VEGIEKPGVAVPLTYFKAFGTTSIRLTTGLAAMPEKVLLG
jgi:hypothetical protein